MSTHASFKAPGEIQFERLFPGSVEELWEYLSKSEKRAEWLASGEMPLQEGAYFTLHFEHSRLSKQKDPVPEKFRKYENGDDMPSRLIELNVPSRLKISWSGGSEVLFELVPKEDNTQLILTHSRLEDSREVLVSVAAGWHTHLGILEDRLFGKEPDGFWKMYVKYEEDYERRLH